MFAPIIAGIASLASAGLGAVGSIAQANAQADAAEYQAKVQRQQAAAERQRAAADAQDFQRRENARLAASRARASGSGIALSGTPLLVDESAVREISLSRGRIVNRGDINATRLENEAELSRATASNARTAGFIGAGTSLLGGISDTATILSKQRSFY